MIKFTWKIWNQLNRKKNQISDFSNFHFSSYVEKQWSRQFLNDVEREPVPTRVLNPKPCGDLDVAPVGCAGGLSPPQTIFLILHKGGYVTIKEVRWRRLHDNQGGLRKEATWQQRRFEEGGYLTTKEVWGRRLHDNQGGSWKEATWQQRRFEEGDYMTTNEVRGRRLHDNQGGSRKEATWQPMRFEEGGYMTTKEVT